MEFGKPIEHKFIVNILLRRAQENAELVGTRMDTDLHGNGLGKQIWRKSIVNILFRDAQERTRKVEKKIYFKIYGRFVSKYLLPIRGNP